jgi:hypothetical protein
MMFKARFHRGIVDGITTLSFRSWKRPRVTVGRTYNIHPIGEILVTSISPTSLDEITAADIKRSGFEDRDELAAALVLEPERTTYRIAFQFKGARVAESKSLRDQLVSADEFEELHRVLAQKDVHTATGPWTRQVLEAIGSSPGVSSALLAEQFDLPRPKFKKDVRKLKKLGLTISLKTGYKLSVRGLSYLDTLQKLD